MKVQALVKKRRGRMRNWNGVERRCREGGGGWKRAGTVTHIQPAAVLLRKTPGGEQERNDKTSSINILSTQQADVYRQFHTTTADPLLSFFFPFFLGFFHMAFCFLSCCQPASQSLAICLHGVSSQLSGSGL